MQQVCRAEPSARQHIDTWYAESRLNLGKQWLNMCGWNNRRTGELYDIIAQKRAL